MEDVRLPRIWRDAFHPKTVLRLDVFFFLVAGFPSIGGILLFFDQYVGAAVCFALTGLLIVGKTLYFSIDHKDSPRDRLVFCIVGVIVIGSLTLWSVWGTLAYRENKEQQAQKTSPPQGKQPGMDQPAPNPPMSGSRSGVPKVPESRTKSETRQFTDKTPLELVRFFREGYTQIQSHELYDPYIGKWMHIHGPIVDAYPDGAGSAKIQVRYAPDVVVDCQFATGWADEALLHVKGEQIWIDGQLGPFQDGAYLFYLNECELPGIKVHASHKLAANKGPLATSHRTYTNKTIPEMMGLYRSGNTGLQNDELIKPFKGLWVKSQGSIQFLGPDYKDKSVAVILVQTLPVECRFPASQKPELARYSNNDTIHFLGRIADNQTSQEFYLQDCEVIEQQ